MPLTLREVAHLDATGSDPAGGAATATQITGSVVGEWIQRMDAPTGTYGVNQAQQFQAAALQNDNASDVENVKFWCPNFIVVPGAAGKVRVKSSSASDDSSKTLRMWMEVSGALVQRDLALNGTSEAVTVDVAAKVLLAMLIDSVSGVTVTATGDISISHGSSAPGEQVSVIPAGKSFATGEVDLVFSASVDDTVQITNRNDPSHVVDGLTYARPNTEATAISGGTIPAGSYRKIWARHRRQVGMPALSEIQVVWQSKQSVV